MNEVNRPKEYFIRRRPFRVLLALTLSFVLYAAANAQTPAYMHDAPSNADLVAFGGDANTLVVQIVNLSPYNIVFKEDPSATNLHDEYGPLGSDPMSRTVAKSFMFAPLGVPKQIPPPPPQAFVPKTLDGQPNPAYIPGWKNTETRPHTMVLSWDDHDGGVKLSWITWTIQNVPCTPHDDRCPPGGGTQNVDLGLFITRDIPEQKTMTAGKYAELVTGVLSNVLTFASIIVDPESALGWVDFFLSLGELSMGTPEQVQAFNDK